MMNLLLFCKTATAVFNFSAELLKHRVTRFILGIIVVFSAGVGIGYAFESLKSRSIIVQIQKPDSSLTGTAIIKEGKTYLDSDFVNKYLQARHIHISFKDISANVTGKSSIK